MAVWIQQKVMVNHGMCCFQGVLVYCKYCLLQGFPQCLLFFFFFFFFFFFVGGRCAGWEQICHLYNTDTDIQRF